MNQEIYIKTLEIAGFSSAMKAMRLPKKSGEKSDSNFMTFGADFETNDYFMFDNQVIGMKIGPNDMKLAQNLIRSGNEHAKAIRGIIVWCEYAMPRYMHQEIDTYTVGMTPLSSESSMHIEAKGLKDEELVKFKETLKEGHIQKRIRAFSYQALRNMYFQRRNHRLPAWREVICPWIESLPLASELIMINPWWQDRIKELEDKIKDYEFQAQLKYESEQGEDI
jgi:hypothetical protein